jgi:hypothetical protein
MSIILDLSIEDYHCSKGVAGIALSKSKLVVLKENGPAAFEGQFITRTVSGKASDALEFGKAFDDMVCMSPAGWHQRYAIRPQGMDGRTAEGKAWAKENAHRETVTHQEFLTMEAMVRAMCDNPLVSFKGGLFQATIRRELTIDGTTVILQARPDFLTETAAWDIKSTKDLRWFDRDCLTYHYHWQAAICQWLLAQEGRKTDFLLIAVEKTVTPRCRVKRIPEVALAAAWVEVKAVITEIVQRTKSGDWTDRQEEIDEIVLKPWQVKELEAVGA